MPDLPGLFEPTPGERAAADEISRLRTALADATREIDRLRDALAEAEVKSAHERRRRSWG